jgi:hypothetical protein
VKVNTLVSTLTKDKKVTFPGGEAIEPRAELLAPMVAAALKRLLPAEAEVHSGWQTQTMPDGWLSGSFQCWLVVDDELVKVDAIARRKEEEDVSDITVRVLPIHRTAPSIVLSHHRPANEIASVERLFQMSVEFGIDGEMFHAEVSAGSFDALSRFVQELTTAAARSRVPRRLAAGRRATG